MAAAASAAAEPAVLRATAKRLLAFSTRCAVWSASEGRSPFPSEEELLSVKQLPKNQSALLRQMPLWYSPGSASMLVQALAVLLRRSQPVAGDFPFPVQLSEQQRRAERDVICALLELLAQLLKCLADKQLLQARLLALALVRGGTLHCLSRILATGCSELLAPSCKLLNPLLVLQPGPVGPDPAAAELVDAVSSSHLLDHAARALLQRLFGMEAEGRPDVLHSTLQCLAVSNAFDGFTLDRRFWPLLRSHQLPGPPLQFLLAAMAVEILCALDGGSRYGLPPSAVTLICEDLDDRAGWHIATLISWTRSMLPGSGGLPRPCILSPKAAYELSLRTCAAACAEVRSLESGMSPSGGTSSGGDSASSSDGASQAAASKQSWAPGSCALVAVSSVLVAHDALRDKWRRRANSACGASQASGDGMVGHGFETAAGRSVLQAPPPPPEAVSQRASSAAGSGSGTSGALRRSYDAAEAASSEAGPPRECKPPSTAERPSRPPRWWRSAVEAVTCMIPPESRRRLAGVADTGSGGDSSGSSSGGGYTISMHTCMLVVCQLTQGQLATELPAVLPPSPPPDVAAALAAGYLPCLNDLLHHVLCIIPEGSAYADLNTPLQDLLAGVFTWPHLAWLTAYGEPREAVALVVTLRKLIGAFQVEAPNSRERDLWQLSLDMVRRGLKWAAARQRKTALGAPRPAVGCVIGVGEVAGSTGGSGGCSGSDSTGSGGSGGGGGGGGGDSSGSCGGSGGPSGSGSSSGGALCSSAHTSPASDSREAVSAAAGSPGYNLARMLACMIGKWLGAWVVCAVSYIRTSLTGSAASLASSQRAATTRFVCELLEVLEAVLDQVGAAASCGGGSSGSSSGDNEAADEWRQLLASVGVPALLFSFVGTIACGQPSNSMLLQALRRVVHGMLTHCPEEMRPMLLHGGGGGVERGGRGHSGGKWPVFQSFLAVWGPRGTSPDADLMRLLRAVREGSGGAAGGNTLRQAAASEQLLPLPLLLPPLSESRGLLRA